jgi:hypothetical protein
MDCVRIDCVGIGVSGEDLGVQVLIQPWVRFLTRRISLDWKLT